MKIYEWKTSQPEETMEFAKRLAEKLKPNDVLTLEGDLGAGKTTFTKGLAQGLGVKKTVNSPTFTIIKEYQGKLPLYHMDVYRLENSDEDLGFEEYFEGNGVTVIEWAQYIQDHLPMEYLNIQIKNAGNNNRIIKMNPVGQRYVELCEELFQ